MKKIIAATLSLLVMGTTALASPTPSFEKDAVTLELGSTLNSKFLGEGAVSGEADGKSGFKYAVAVGLGNDLAVEYRGGKFQSENFSVTMLVGGVPTTVDKVYGKSIHQEINLIHQINPSMSAVVGWVQNKFSYNKVVADAKVSAIHAGLLGNHKLDDKTALFASVIGGKDVIFWEAGFSRKLAKDANLNVSYARREFKNVDFNTLAPLPSGKENYILHGISCVVSVKL